MLDALEAQYYRAVLENPALENHLLEKGIGYEYAGSCRSVSFKMPEHQVSMLTGAISSEVRRYLEDNRPVIKIWRSDNETGIKRESIQVYPIKKHSIGSWEVIVDDAIINSAVQYRASSLPSETGGILLGTIDIPRRQICIVSIVPAPKDSYGSTEGFERGIKNLLDIVESARLKTIGQVEYVGEWHSHPRGAAPLPSETDVSQLVWLGEERKIEDLPALMMIVGANNKYSMNMVYGAEC